MRAHRAPMLLLAFASAALAEAPRECPRQGLFQRLDPDGGYRCLELPLEVRFPQGVAVKRIETAEALVLEAQLPGGLLAFVHRPFPWSELGDAPRALDAYAATVLRSLGLQDVQLLAASAIQVPGAQVGRGARFTALEDGAKQDGEVRAYLARSWMVVQASLGKPGSAAAAGGAAAKAFLDSFLVAPRSASAGEVELTTRERLRLPPEAWELLSARLSGEGERVLSRGYQLASPNALLVVREILTDVQTCEQGLRAQREALGKDPHLASAKIDPASIRIEQLARGPALYLEGQSAGPLPAFVSQYLACSSASLVQLILSTPEKTGAARPLLQQLAASLHRPPFVPGSSPPKGMLRVAMAGNDWPLRGTEGAQRFGLEAVVAKALAAQLGMEVRFAGKEELGGGALEGVASGKADVAISGIAPSAEGRAQVDFTAPYLTLRTPQGPAPLAIAVPKGQAARYDAALSDLGPLLAQLEQTYRPGQPLPADLVFAPCSGKELADVGPGVSIRPAAPLPPNAQWFAMRWDRAGADLTDATSAPDMLCLDAAAPVTRAAPDAARRQVKEAVREFVKGRSGRRGLSVMVDSDVPGWVSLGEGVLATSLTWSDSCTGEAPADCSATGHLVVVTDGRRQKWQALANPAQEDAEKSRTAQEPPAP